MAQFVFGAMFCVWCSWIKVGGNCITCQVEAMIDIMKGMLAEYFNLESGERLRRFFTQETRFDSGNVK